MTPLPWLSLYPIECFAILGTFAMAVVRWLPVPTRRLVGTVATVVTVVSGVTMLVIGLRWQMVPVLVGAALAVPAVATVIRQRTPREVPRWLANLGVLFLVGLVAAGPVAAWAMPVPAFPEPTGRYATGTTVLQWTDASREETATEDPDDQRVVVAQLWYPAASDEGERAPYFGRTLQEARTVASGVLTLSQTAGYRVEVPGTTPETFTDAPLWLPPVPHMVGTKGRYEGPRETTEITALFLDHVLRGSGTDLRAELSRYGSLHTPGSG